jgi:hypothetical protein
LGDLGHFGWHWFVGRLLIIAGLALVVIGLLITLAPSILARLPWLGRLPGDLSLKFGTVRIFVPLATCFLLSLVLTVLARLFFK